MCYFCANLLARAYRIANCVIRDPRCAAPPSAVRTPSLEGSHNGVDDQRLDDHLPVEGQPCKGGRGHSWSIISSSSSSSLFCFLGFFPPLLPPAPPIFKDSPALPRLATGERLITSPEHNVQFCVCKIFRKFQRTLVVLKQPFQSNQGPGTFHEGMGETVRVN